MIQFAINFLESHLLASLLCTSFLLISVDMTVVVLDLKSFLYVDGKWATGKPGSCAIKART